MRHGHHAIFLGSWSTLCREMAFVDFLNGSRLPSWIVIGVLGPPTKSV